ncbi:MAG TPA: hypothetical protein VJV22_19335 [Acidobacteriaceae bacterium]|nr:hypothetical protein [Acidobacteriaceae bacterium]
MSNALARRACALAAFAFVSATLIPVASAQSGWSKFKQRVLEQSCKGGDQNSCQQLAKMKQAQQGQPAQPTQQTGAAPQQYGRPAAAPPPQDHGGPFKPPAGTRVDEVVLAPLQQNAKFFISPHGVHVATLENSGSRAVLYYDGVPGPKFDEILGGQTGNQSEFHVSFSPDGKRYGYCGRSGSELVVMVDGKELLRTSESWQGRFDARSCEIGFTSNSQHVYLKSAVSRSSTRGETFTRFFFDGKPSPPSTSVDPVFSPDGNHYAYVATLDTPTGSTWSLVVDGKVAPWRGGSPQWSADSQHLYTTIEHPGEAGYMEAMIDGRPFIKADRVVLHVPPAGNMVVAEIYAYRGANAQRPLEFLAIGGKKVPGTEIVTRGGPRIDQITFSPDGKHIAARFSTAQNSQYVFLDGKRGQEYQSLDHIAFTADSSRVVYTAFTNAKPYVVIGDQESDPCSPLSGAAASEPGGLTIAPVGGHAGTVCGLTGSGTALFLDGKMVRPAQDVDAGSDLRYSPDGQHYAYTAHYHGGGNRLVVDGVPQNNSNLAQATTVGMQFVFSPDSQHTAVYSLPPSPTGQFSSGVVLDGKYLPSVATPAFYRLEFTADSKHIAWAQPVPSQHTFLVFVDGKPVAEAETAIDPNSREAWWDMAPDGSLSFMAQDDNNLKRITITPSPGTNVAALLGGGGAGSQGN